MSISPGVTYKPVTVDRLHRRGRRNVRRDPRNKTILNRDVHHPINIVLRIDNMTAFQDQVIILRKKMKRRCAHRES